LKSKGVVLLVEDNDLNRDMLSRRLETRGYEVVSADDGAKALKLLQDPDFDVVILDLSLPVIDGWELARRIRDNEKTSALPVIALTAHAMPEDRGRALVAGCNDYETKPVDFECLLEKIAKHTGQA
jgi:CheY-like chemotaxis protein